MNVSSGPNRKIVMGNHSKNSINQSLQSLFFMTFLVPFVFLFMLTVSRSDGRNERAPRLRIVFAGEMGPSPHAKKFGGAMNELDPDLVMCTGDYGDTNQKLEYMDKPRWRDFARHTIDETHVPLLSKYGDHDAGTLDPESNDPLPDRDGPVLHNYIGQRESGSYQCGSLVFGGVHIVYFSDQPSHKSGTEELLTFLRNALKRHTDKTSFVMVSKFAMGKGLNPSKDTGIAASSQENRWTPGLFQTLRSFPSVAAVFNSDDEVAWNDPENKGAAVRDDFNFNQYKLDSTKSGGPSGEGYEVLVADFYEEKIAFRSYDVPSRTFHSMENAPKAGVLEQKPQYGNQTDHPSLTTVGGSFGSGRPPVNHHRVWNGQEWTQANFAWADRYELVLTGSSKKNRLENPHFHPPGLERLPKSKGRTTGQGYGEGWLIGKDSNLRNSTDRKGFVRFDSRNGQDHYLATDAWRSSNREGADDNGLNMLPVVAGETYTWSLAMHYGMRQKDEPPMRMEIRWFNSKAKQIGSNSTEVIPEGDKWQRKSLTATAPEGAVMAVGLVEPAGRMNESVQQIIGFDDARFYNVQRTPASGSENVTVKVNGRKLVEDLDLKPGQSRSVQLPPAAKWSFSLQVKGSYNVDYRIRHRNVRALGRNVTFDLTPLETGLAELDSSGFARWYNQGRIVGLGHLFYIREKTVQVHGRDSETGPYSNLRATNANQLDGRIAGPDAAGFEVRPGAGHSAEVHWKSTDENGILLSLNHVNSPVTVDASSSDRGAIRINSGGRIRLTRTDRGKRLHLKLKEQGMLAITGLQPGETYRLYRDGDDGETRKAGASGSISLKLEPGKHRVQWHTASNQ